MKPAIVARKNQNNPVKRISNGNLKAKCVCPSIFISLSEKTSYFTQSFYSVFIRLLFKIVEKFEIVYEGSILKTLKNDVNNNAAKDSVCIVKKNYSKFAIAKRI